MVNFLKNYFYYSAYNAYYLSIKENCITESFRNLMLELKNSLNVLLSTLE